MRVRTRFAPSPTGYLHIGGMRTALYAYLYAKQHGGDFILRLEDTDRERLVEDAAQLIYDSMKEAGLVYDEGPDIGGPCGPYIQSERRDIYLKYAARLVRSGDAYYCFCTKERLEEMHANGATKYDKHCLHIPLEEAEEGGISDPRNRTMSIMFSLIGLVERAGTGIPRMRQACRDVGLPDPLFSEDYEPERVTVTLSLIGRQEEDDLESSILRLISSDGRISMDEMSRRLGVSRSAVIKTIDRLKDRGVLSREGGTRGRWVLSGKRRYPITDTGSSGAVHSH